MGKVKNMYRLRIYNQLRYLYGKVPKRFYGMSDKKLGEEWEQIAESRNRAFVGN